MKILLVGDANSIFFVEYVKALKKMMDITVCVYSPEPNKNQYSQYPYDEVYFDDYKTSKWMNNKVYRVFIAPFVIWNHFLRFLNKTQTRYDAIHLHWLLSAWTINPKKFHKYTNHLLTTFWGGELESMQLLYSHCFYLKRLGKLLNEADYCIDSSLEEDLLYKKYPQIKQKSYFGIYGSSIIECLSKMASTVEEAKSTYKIDKDKITVLLGYSGKRIHRHCDLLNLIKENAAFESYKERIHFILPMTRGASDDYINKVEAETVKTGCTYTIIKNTYQTDKDVATLRLATDIAFQVTDFDGLSNSIKEILCAGTVLISGDWYPNYGILKTDGFHYLEVNSIQKAVDIFFSVLPNLDTYKKSFETNKNVAKTNYSWTECIKPWAALYNKCNNNEAIL